MVWLTWFAFQLFLYLILFSLASFFDPIQATKEERENKCCWVNQARKDGCFFQKVCEYQLIHFSATTSCLISKFLLQFVAAEQQHPIDQRVHPRSLARSPKMATNPKIPRLLANLRVKLVENPRVVVVNLLLLLKNSVINPKSLILQLNQRMMTLARQNPLPSLSMKLQKVENPSKKPWRLPFQK